MDRDIQQAEKMALKSKEEIKKRMRVMFPSSSVDLEDSSFSGPGDNGKLPSPSSRKRRFPSMRRVFGKILSILMPCVCLSSEEEDSSFVSDRKTDASFSAAVHRSSEGHPENDLPAGQQKEAVEGLRILIIHCFTGTSYSAQLLSLKSKKFNTCMSLIETK